MPSGRDRPLYNTDPPSCNSSALTSRRAFALLVPEPTFSERSLQWLLFATRHFCRFGPFLTSTAPSAGGITPFLQNCRLTVMIYRLYSDSHTTSQNSNTMKFFRFCYNGSEYFSGIFRKVYHFAKSAGTRCGATASNLRFSKSAFLKCHIDKTKRLGYTGIRSFLECFRKVIYFAKIFVPFSDTKKDAERRPFYVIPLRNPIPSTALRL